LVDRGDPAYVTAGERDLAGNPRVAGMAPDIGAFEFQPPVAPPPPPPNEAPKLGKVSMSNTVFAPVAATAASPRRARRRVKRGTIFRYVLSEPAGVTIALERRARGVRARARARGRVRCVALTRKRARGKQKGKPCTRWLRSGTLKALQQAGSQSTPFGGRFKGRALKPGSYRARVVASDGRARSRERRLPFRIVRAR
ncbi:MAG TPA: choice-of-anchor Q domain-containing protein, partial [Thermoleophilaceae bacterium]|nr:choice-of-anchor Q domain-containing protein [Thermoleophilaceae bacterium]